MNDLEMYREQLALCDDRIIDALVERNSIVEKIMVYKEKYGMPILQPAQEEKQKKKLEEKLKGNKYHEGYRMYLDAYFATVSVYKQESCSLIISS